MKKKHPEFRYMIVSITAFVCTAVTAIVQSYAVGELSVVLMTLAPIIFMGSLLVPLFTKIDAYSEFFKSQARSGNFSASFAINEYKLTGWIKGKYLFLEAMSDACNGSFETAFEKYVKCLDRAEDKRLRLACYKDMVKNLKRMNSAIRLVPYILRGCEEFPDAPELFEWVSGYYMWSRYADRNEACEWFRKVTEGGGSDVIKARAYFFLGVCALYSKEYEKAEGYYIKAYELFGTPHCYLCIELAVCHACLGKYDEAREYAMEAMINTDNKDDVDYIAEKLDYMFRIKTGEVNPETEKLVNELIRRREADAEKSVAVADIERYTAGIEALKNNS